MSDEPKESEITGEPIIVVGVVHPHGNSGWASQEKGWTLQFKFETWRGEDDGLHATQLILRRASTREEFDRYWNEIKPYEILAARVIFTGSNTAQVLEFLDQTVNKDDPLTQRAAELLKPKTYEHEFFGTFRFDREIDWYQVNTVWVDREIRLALSASEDADLEAALRVALELWKDQTAWNQRIQDYAVQKLLNLKNNNWLDIDESELTPDEFKSRMSLDSITVYPKGDFEFWHNDGDLFFSHFISVSGSLQDGPTDADIPG